MNFWVSKLALIGFVSIMMGCSSYSNIYSNYDKSIDFTSYHTFAWAPDSGIAKAKEFDNTAYDNDIVRNNAKNYITHSFSHRGYLVDTDSPDVVLQLVLLNEKKERVVSYHSYPYSGYYYHNPYYFPYYYPYYRYYTWPGWNYSPFWDDHVTTYTKTYVKGTITINMYDRKLKKLVWTGSAEGDIYDPRYIQFDVHPAIDRIMKKFPVKSVEPRGKDELPFGNKIVRANGLNEEFRQNGYR